MKQAINIDQQINRLRERGVVVDDEEKSKEILLDVGYYRLGFYLFPFEKSYPDLRRRTHEVREGTKLNDAVTLYYFDFDIRNILMRYICRIEVAFRTYMTYCLSNRYVDNPQWFVDEKVVGTSFDIDRHYALIKKNRVIANHHEHYGEDGYAPAWKTMEFMTLGGVLDLYRKLKRVDDKREVSIHFGVKQTEVFENYVDAMRRVRNICAHGTVLYDAKLQIQIRKGPAGLMQCGEGFRLGGAIKVIAFLLRHVSVNRENEMFGRLKEAYNAAVHKSASLREIIENASMFNWESLSMRFLNEV